MYEINKNVVYVKGALNGAIYNFNTNKVYSINSVACDIVNKLIIESNENFLDDEKGYVGLLIDNNLFSNEFQPRRYVPESKDNITLSLVWLEITQACNLRCLHCYEGNEHKASNNMLSIEKWKGLVDELNQLNVPNVVVIGGEPCLYKDVKELLQYLSQYKIDTTLFTNATLLDDELKRIIIDKKIKVKVSLYGHKAEIHDAITKKKGSFDALISNVKYLIENDVTVYIAVVAMKENQEYLEEIEELIKSLGVPYKGYDVIRNVFGGQQIEHTPDKEEVIAKAKFTKPSFTTTKQQFDSNCYRNSCWYGKFAITETGEIIPCVFERNISYGNVNSQSIKEILNSHLLYKNWFRDFSKIEICKDCEFRFACKDCRPLGISVCGDVSGKNPRCLYNPYSGEWNNDVT